ncbi:MULTISPECIES: class I SAM-dependent methyltransferase [unclassified Streptomyces]|uniref:class I SAM-dependent methyltransferase n=1 Tax=unclassified Streptomyces TaxID=2593676 RepID=UPI001BEC7DF4|nr:MULTISPECIES: class I SAM-dependent methyltransferase [unclassified Streptomyces]MBT2405745.1 class I SAM-dependent methyltransferase [Streptomyces sp. ISL-21]MBT2610359.1 class I SAM-dependent methyltransferase [Streptomyces sp. ISL-87]
MPTHSVGPEIIAFYSETISESDRLSSSADGVLEMVRTQELLRRHLPGAPARVIDIGSGPGAHARWLAKDGYEVDLVDPVPRHVEEAAAAGFHSALGDARALAAADDTYDVALVLGPLYHLLEHGDRLQALREAARVVRPGGLVAAAAIGRYASLFEHVATTMLTVDRVRAAVTDILVSGLHEPGRKGFTSAYFHTGESLAAEMREAGLSEPRVYGVEGPAWSALKATEQHTRDSLIDSKMFEAALTAARLAEPHPDLLAASSHMLAVATV